MTPGGQTIATANIDLRSHAFSGWEMESVTLTSEGEGSLLSFVNNGMGGCNASFKNCAPIDPAARSEPPFSPPDGVSRTGSAPEPSTWAVMVIGFAASAYAGFRSRNRAAISAA